MTGSRLVNGSMKLHNELEEKLAAYHGKESALVFTTGYQVNLATISALLVEQEVRRGDRPQRSRLDLRRRAARPGRGRADGALQAQRRRVARPGALRARRPTRARFVITDGVFSAEGEIAQAAGDRARW